MKSKSFLCLSLLLLTSIVLQAQSLLPSSVQQFLNEQRYREQFKMMSPEDLSLLRFVSPRIVDDVEVVDAFIAFDDESMIERLHDAGVWINSVFDGFVTAQIPTDILVKVSMMPGVKDVEISRKLSLCTDSTMHATDVTRVQAGLSYGLPANYDGSGVIVGIIDLGYDFQHRAFRSNDDPSKTRIVRVYHTQDNSGHKAKYNQTAVLPGSVFMNDEIYALTTDKGSNTHGTHTASIAAGSHINGYGGMAPGADIVMCAISLIEGNISAVEIANCVRYIDSYADSVGMPCVMSLSVSTPNGQHDGLDYLSKVVKQITGPGRLFVIAAGNNSGLKPYAHHKSTPSSPLNVMFTCKNSIGGDSTYYYKGVAADVWMRNSNANFYYKYHILDKNTGTIVWESQVFGTKSVVYASQIGEYYKRYSSTDTASYISAESSYVSQGKKYRLEVSLHNLVSQEYTLVNGVKKSRYAIGLTIYPRNNNPCEIDAWIGNSSARFGVYNNKVTTMDGSVLANFYAAPSDSCCIGTYAVGDSTISAGAYSARNRYFSMKQNKIVTDYSYTVGDIASFSAYQVRGAGPTGEALPTICAPGTCVVAAANRYSYLANSSETVMKTDDGSFWGVMSGTSMAAPTVAGIIALWLQANPNLSVADVKEVLAQTATHDRYTLSKPLQFGPNGKINALSGMQYILKKMKQPLIGDVNGDGVVNITDVTCLINYLLSKQGHNIDFQNSDVDGDGRINISDLTELVNNLLSSPAQ